MSESVSRNLITFKAACAKGGFGRSKLYELIGADKIAAYKDGHQTKVDGDSVDAYLASLPRLVIKPSKKKKPSKRPAPAADVPV
jgi:excisionase family DNA binding protein